MMNQRRRPTLVIPLFASALDEPERRGAVMMLTIYGPNADVDSFCVHDDGPGSAVSAWRALNHRSSQATRIGVHWRHRGVELGGVVHLEHSAPVGTILRVRS